MSKEFSIMSRMNALKNIDLTIGSIIGFLGPLP